ncbi:MAG TPA: DNA translocase FtsK 4TM domain-containing protein [Candidatus Dormibacteraeota bacterium]|jgi:S-DNA-T family DNA segregation ATPase FtsK/SpoIIIE|nr:DNA translocase FtsK 4TM domain-containing protein [Candidatus Dormibacteraeota bacterium]
MPQTRRTSRARSAPAPRRRAAPKRPAAARGRRPAARGPSLKLPAPQIKLTEGQRREGLGLLLVVLALIFTLAAVFAPGGLGRVRTVLLDAVGLGWLAVVAILIAGGGAMIVGGPAGEGGVRASRNSGAVLLGMVLLAACSLGLLEVALLPPGQWPTQHVQPGGYLGALVATPLNNALSAWGAAIVLAGGWLFGAMLGFDVSLGALVRRVRFAGPEPDDEEELAAEERELGLSQPERRRGGRVAEAPVFPSLLPLDPPDEVAVAEPELEPGGEPVLSPRLTLDAERARAEAEAEWAAAAEAAHRADEEEPRKVWALPPLTLLDPLGAKQEKLQEEVKRNIEVIEQSLASFGVAARVRGVNSGASVTQYELEPAKGVQVRKITALQNDLALALAAPIRIQAPIPGKSAVGIEVPNKASTLVTLREVIQSATFQSASNLLAMPIGSDVSGQPIAGDLTRMPHVLIAGATGSGKSVCVNAILAGFLLRNSPDQLKLIMIDPKRVEMALYRDIPHLLVPVVTEPDHAVAALRWAVAEMESRYKLFASHAVRNLAGFNAKAPEIGLDPLPYTVIVIDELADLMMVSGNEVEELICRVAQLARAVGIHLMVATQRPSADIITGLIKANIPSRIAFAVSSGVDSRVILDEVGAEKLLGRGDMLYLPVDAGKATRIQGVMVSDKELDAIIQHWKGQGPPSYQEEIFNLVSNVSWAKDAGKRDPMFERAARIVASEGRAATSLLQRKLSIGYTRAARIIDQLAEHGVVGPYEGSKSREVLMSLPELDDLFSRLESAGEPVTIGLAGADDDY